MVSWLGAVRIIAMIAVASPLEGTTRVGADRQPTPEFAIDTEESGEPASFGSMSIETHADKKRQYPL
ncbi:hypothetical protein C496_05597 [Natronorubrum tibetense GA33]|uniref:Uncharacterized protein n=1 Tax=Natronorubrum tibetense GA33 TaxID=1114856 RepID=L9VZU8_9EURY|nr:hypothetical protein C496_05597 [Natronorubrum tibetense GA33]